MGLSDWSLCVEWHIALSSTKGCIMRSRLNRPFIWTTTLGLCLVFGSAHAQAVPIPAERDFVFEVLSKTNKDAIAKYRDLYQARNKREVAHLPEAEQATILGALSAAADLGYQSKLKEANALLAKTADQFPKEAMLRWHVAATYFLIGRGYKDEETQAVMYKQGIEHAKVCLEVSPDTPDCWLAYAALLGSLSLAEGIIDTISAMEEVNSSLHKAYELSSQDPYPLGPYGIDSKHVATGGITEFYRLVPDWWIFGVLAGVRGDKEKAWEYAKTMAVHDLGSANIVIRAALCYGAESEDMSIISHGLKLIDKTLKFEITHPLDESEYRRFATLYNKMSQIESPDFGDYYDLGCLEFGNADKSKLDK